MIQFHDNEKLILERRKHWFPIMIEGLFLFVVGLFPFVILLGAFQISAEWQAIIENNMAIFLFLAIGWFFLTWIIFSIIWTNYYLDVFLVTNKRVIDVEQKSLFARELAELRLENLQDIKVEIVGVLPSLLKFGNLHIQSAGFTKEFIVINIRDPQEVKDIIAKQRDALTAFLNNINNKKTL